MIHGGNFGSTESCGTDPSANTELLTQGNAQTMGGAIILTLVLTQSKVMHGAGWSKRFL